MHRLLRQGPRIPLKLVVPHQANKTMVTNLAVAAGLSADQLYFDIERVGNVSAASIPIAIYDSVQDGVIRKPTRVFAPGFGAGAVGGYAVLRIDPAIVVPERGVPAAVAAVPAETHVPSSEDMRLAFGD